MKLLTMLKIAYVILFVSLLSSCSTVEVKDTEWCSDLGIQGAYCFNTLSTDSREVAKEEWDKERVGMLCTSSDDFAEWKAVILKLCRYAGRRCTYEDKIRIQTYLNNFQRNIGISKIIDNDKNSRFD